MPMGVVLYIINDDRQLDRLPPLIEQCEKYGIDYEIVPACIDKKTILESITESFKRLVRFAKGTGMNEIWIAEDDLMFPSDGSWEYFVKNKPKDFDVYIGGSYLIHNEWKYEPPTVKVNEWVGNHLIVISERYYDRWLETKDFGHIDSEQRGKGEFYVCFPYAALQRPSKSANCNYQQVNYNTIVPREYIYKG